MTFIKLAGKYFRVLTDYYRIPEAACKLYKLVFDKLKKFENDLVMYIHFESNRFFPLAIEMENYLSENKFNYYGKVKKFNGKTDWL